MPASETLRSRANPLYKRLRALKQKGTAGGLCLLEGPKLTREAIGAGLTLLEAAASARAESTPGGTLALAELRERGVPVRRMAALNMVNLDRIPRDKVGLGSLVTVAVEDSGEETVFEIVVPEDADPTIGRISPSSPIGKCLLGHEEGDTVEVRVPAGVRSYEIRKLVTMHDQVKEQ